MALDDHPQILAIYGNLTSFTPSFGHGTVDGIQWEYPHEWIVIIFLTFYWPFEEIPHFQTDTNLGRWSDWPTGLFQDIGIALAHPLIWRFPKCGHPQIILKLDIFVLKHIILRGSPISRNPHIWSTTLGCRDHGHGRCDWQGRSLVNGTCSGRGLLQFTPWS